MKSLKPVALLLFGATLLAMIAFEDYREGLTLALGLFAAALFLIDLREGESDEGKEFEEY